MIWLMPLHHCSSQSESGQELKQVEFWRPEQSQRPWKSALTGLLVLVYSAWFFCRTQLTMNWAPPHQTLINKMPYIFFYKDNLMAAFSQTASLFLDDCRLHQIDIKRTGRITLQILLLLNSNKWDNIHKKIKSRSSNENYL